MFHNSLAQPKIIDDLKKIFEDIGLHPNVPAEVHSSIERALQVIADHKAAPGRFRRAMDDALEKLKATPLEAFHAIREIQDGSELEDALDDRERMYFASSMGQFETMDAAKAKTFVETNPESWRIWQESAKFWQVELS